MFQQKKKKINSEKSEKTKMWKYLQRLIWKRRYDKFVTQDNFVFLFVRDERIDFLKVMNLAKAMSKKNQKKCLVVYYKDIIVNKEIFQVHPCTKYVDLVYLPFFMFSFDPHFPYLS